MPAVTVTIGGREFEVACQEGEEHYLRAAAGLLDGEAGVLVGQMGRMPEGQLLLMSGLMLADKTAGLEEKLRRAEAAVAERDAKLAELKDRPEPEPRTVEVGIVPPGLPAAVEAAARRAEAMAERLEKSLPQEEEAEPAGRAPGR
ncbi:cell division protein ZapA [Hasllibacter halocynthiae]|uniref:Cell division protein ZapA n=1 Tax=Hasllibacter halocynthiae TaxID=595589 RepID=A0A2T0X9B3_9RHOB|nr:cell division protein ZapA [Hasllibacter halocynthiae]PRY95517.1 cell division protein ZapA [Hasllibacter halocynthiae]